MRSTAICLAFLMFAGCDREGARPAVPEADGTATQTSEPETTAPSATEASTAPIESRSASEVVAEFGRRLKLVSTAAPRDVSVRTLREHYAGLVAPELLDEWAARPELAPGRRVSSPWPDRIEVRSASQSGSEADIEADLVEATSTGDARRIPVQIELRDDDGRWVITRYEVLDPEQGGAAADAAAVIDSYYAAISEGDYERAWRLWSNPPQSLEAFEKGFADTASVQVKTGTPSRIGAAAGSRYVDVPVTISAKTKSGVTQRFAGTYTLRRSVVEGGNPSWRIDHASINSLADR